MVRYTAQTMIVSVTARVCGLKEAGTAAGGDATDQELEDRYNTTQHKLRSMQRPFELRCGWHRVAGAVTQVVTVSSTTYIAKFPRKLRAITCTHNLVLLLTSAASECKRMSDPLRASQ